MSGSALYLTLGLLAVVALVTLIVLVGSRSRRSAASDTIPGPGSNDPRRRELIRQRELEVLRELEAQGKSSESEPDRDPATFDELRTRFGHLAKPAVHLRATSQKSGFTKLGGLPALPAEIEWPSWNGKPHSFLAQIDLAEIHAVLPSFLPPAGRLYFFYDQDQGVWGFDPKERGGWRVIYSAAEGPAPGERAAPAGLPSEAIYKPKHLRPSCIEVLPGSETLPRDKFDWDADGDAYLDLCSAPFQDEHRHQMLGYPDPIQNPNMEEECQLASNGLYVGDETGYKDPRATALKAGAVDWKLLLQLDTDDDTGWMWGDVGTLYFWIREQDARNADFDKAWVVLQCS